MLNAGGNLGALREPRKVAPAPKPLPVAPVGNAGNTGWNGGAVQLHVVTPAPVTKPTKPNFDVRQLRHPDVLLPLVAALIVVLVLLAWGA